MAETGRRRGPALGLAAVLLALAAFGARAEVVGPVRPPDLPEGVVTRVVDGDTIDVRLDGRSQRIRLIGVDAPELHESEKLDREAARTHRSRAVVQALGRRATAFTGQRLLGRRVGVERDVELRDQYGRRLAYVWLADGTLFNAELVRKGWARVLTIPPNVRRARLFRDLEREARAASRGLWAPGDTSWSSPPSSDQEERTAPHPHTRKDHEQRQ